MVVANANVAGKCEMKIIIGMAANVGFVGKDEMKAIIGMVVNVIFVGKRGMKIMIGMVANVTNVVIFAIKKMNQASVKHVGNKLYVEYAMGLEKSLAQNAMEQDLLLFQDHH